MKQLLSVLCLVALLCPVSAWAADAMAIMEAASGVVNFPTEDSATVTTDTLIKTGKAYMRCVMLEPNDATPTDGDIVIYDNTSASGTTVFKTHITTAFFAPIETCPEKIMNTGIYVDFTTTTDVNVRVTGRGF